MPGRDARPTVAAGGRSDEATCYPGEVSFLATRTPRILVVGSANMDLVVKAPRLPRTGESLLGSDFQMVRGGKGANQAVACARLGAETWMLGRVGTDAFGDNLRQGLSGNGVNTSCVRRDPEAPSGIAIIIIDADGDNSIVVAPGANMRGQAEDLRSIPDLSSFDAVLMQLEVPLELIAATIGAARAAGVRTILDAGPPRGLPAELVQQVDVLSPNETEAAAILGGDTSGMSPGEVAKALRDRGAQTVVLKLGERGALALGAEEGQPAPAMVPGFRVEVVDTTGAGDAFTAGLAVSLSGGHSLQDSTRYGCACGALAVTVMGAQPSMPTQAGVEAFLAERQESAG